MIYVYKQKRNIYYIWVFPKIMVPPNHPSRVFHYKPSILGVPLFLETPIYIIYYIYVYLIQNWNHENTVQWTKTPFEGFLLTSWILLMFEQFALLSTLPRTNSLPLKLGYPKRKQSSSNHKYSWINSLLVSGRVIWFHLPKPHNENHLNSGVKGQVHLNHVAYEFDGFFRSGKDPWILQ